METLGNAEAMLLTQVRALVTMPFALSPIGLFTAIVPLHLMPMGFLPLRRLVGLFERVARLVGGVSLLVRHLRTLKRNRDCQFPRESRKSA
jgi:hypothetical protein